MMNGDDLQQLARQLLDGSLAADRFVDRVRAFGTADVGEACVDLDRRRRCGFPEVVFAQGKTVAAIEKIFRALIDDGADVLATRLSAEQAAELTVLFPEGHYNPVARTFRIPLAAEGGQAQRRETSGTVAIVTAGTSDLPVAEEARERAGVQPLRRDRTRACAGPPRRSEREQVRPRARRRAGRRRDVPPPHG